MANFSVVIPTYNRIKSLKRAIDSVVGQTFPKWELIVVDDGSTDETQVFLKALQKKWKLPQKLSIYHQENQGVSAARNFGIKYSKSPWLAFLDSDDEWLPSKLEEQSQIIVKNPHSKLIHCEEIWIRNGVRVNAMNKHKKLGGRIFSHCLPLCCISPSATAVKKEVFHQVGLFREDFLVCEDYDLWLKVTSHYEVDFIPTPQLIKYGGHQDQLSKKYVAMDYWRVKSLFEIRNSDKLSEQEKILLNKTALKKCRILLNGYKKHNNFKNYNEVLSYFNTLKQESITYTQSD